jgi:hypothetical protein
MSEQRARWRMCAQRVRRGTGVWLAEIREYPEDGKSGSRFVAEMTPEDAAQVVADRERVARLEKDLELAAVRLQIAADRMRACHEKTGQHELLFEIDSFAEEARAALAGRAARSH